MKTGIVAGFQKVAEFVDQNVFHAGLRFSGKPCIQPDLPGFHRTASPAGLHLPQLPAGAVDFHNGLPVLCQAKNGMFQCADLFLRIRKRGFRGLLPLFYLFPGMADPAFLAPDEADRLVFPHVPGKRCQNTAFRRLHIEVQIFHLPPFHGDRNITQHKFFLFHDQSITLILSITG